MINKFVSTQTSRRDYKSGSPAGLRHHILSFAASPYYYTSSNRSVSTSFSLPTMCASIVRLAVCFVVIGCLFAPTNAAHTLQYCGAALTSLMHELCSSDINGIIATFSKRSGKGIAWHLSNICVFVPFSRRLKCSRHSLGIQQLSANRQRRPTVLRVDAAAAQHVEPCRRRLVWWTFP